MKNTLNSIAVFIAVFIGYGNLSFFWVFALSLMPFFGTFTNSDAMHAQQQRIDSGKIGEATKTFMSAYLYAFIVVSIYYVVGFFIGEIF